MSYYPTTLAFAKNSPSETNFYCMSCAKDKFGESPHETEEVMMINYHNQMSFIRCNSCRDIIKEE
jgi:hypothetical protein